MWIVCESSPQKHQILVHELFHVGILGKNQLSHMKNMPDGWFNIVKLKEWTRYMMACRHHKQTCSILPSNLYFIKTLYAYYSSLQHTSNKKCFKMYAISFEYHYFHKHFCLWCTVLECTIVCTAPEGDMLQTIAFLDCLFCSIASHRLDSAVVSVLSF